MTEQQLDPHQMREALNTFREKTEAQLMPLIQWNIEHKRKFFDGLLLATIGAIAGLLAAKGAGDVIQNHLLHFFALVCYFAYLIYHAVYFVCLLTYEGAILDARLVFYRSSFEKAHQALQDGIEVFRSQLAANSADEDVFAQKEKRSLATSNFHIYALALLFILGSFCAALSFFYKDIAELLGAFCL